MKTILHAAYVYPANRPLLRDAAVAFDGGSILDVGPFAQVRQLHPDAAVTDLGGGITGVHRTWLDPSGRDKAPIASPRRAMGHLLGHGVRFGMAADVIAAA